MTVLLKTPPKYPNLKVMLQKLTFNADCRNWNIGYYTHNAVKELNPGQPRSISNSDKVRNLNQGAPNV